MPLVGCLLRVMIMNHLVQVLDCSGIHHCAWHFPLSLVSAIFLLGMYGDFPAASFILFISIWSVQALPRHIHCALDPTPLLCLCLQYSWNNRAVETGEDLWPLHITCLESSNMGNSSARVISLGWRSSRTVVEAVSEHEECFFRGIQYATCLEWGDGNNHGVRGCPKLKLSCQKSGSWRSLDVNYDVIYSYKPRLLGLTVYEVAVSSTLFFTFFLLGSCSLPVKLVVNKNIKYAPIFCSW